MILSNKVWGEKKEKTTTTADYMLVFMLHKILSLSCNLHAFHVVECESQQQFDLITSPHKKNSGFLALAIFIFLLCTVSPSTVCL